MNELENTRTSQSSLDNLLAKEIPVTGLPPTQPRSNLDAENQRQEAIHLVKEYAPKIIQAAQQYKVTPEAIAGAILWEALENPYNRPGILRTNIPGKIHPVNYYSLNLSEAEKVERDGRVPPLFGSKHLPPAASRFLSETLEVSNPAAAIQARIIRLRDPQWAITYAAAIMDRHAEDYEKIAGVNIRNDTGVLTTLYHQGRSEEKANKLARDRRTAQQQNQPLPGAKVPSEEMGEWVVNNIQWIRGVIQEGLKNKSRSEAQQEPISIPQKQTRNTFAADLPYDVVIDEQRGCLYVDKATGEVLTTDEWIAIIQQTLEQRLDNASQPSTTQSPSLQELSQLPASEYLRLPPSQLLALHKSVEQRQRTEPPQSFPHEIKHLQERVTSLKKELASAIQTERQQAQTYAQLEQRGVRDWLNPFGVNYDKMYDAWSQLRDSQEIRSQAETNLQQTSDRLAVLQQRANTYHDWAKSSETQTAAIIAQKLIQPDVNSRFQELQQLTKDLQQWQQAAATLERPQLYQAQVHQLIKNYINDESLPSQALAAMQQDLSAYQQQQAQLALQGNISAGIEMER